MQKPLIIFPLALLVTASCGKAPPTPSFFEAEEEETILPPDGSNIDGLYMAKFLTLNPHINGTLLGSATIQRKQDDFFAYVRLFSGGAHVWHQQHVYTGKRCPTLQDDKNGDGFIDSEEGKKIWGDVIIPLDSNINSQLRGNNIYPVADESGTYFYERVGSFEKMFFDLKQDDHSLVDDMVKLNPDDGLAIEGKVAVIYGVDASVELPSSVYAMNNLSPQKSLPIACGVFKRVTRIPGEDYDGTIPGPVADVEDGQDRPSDDGWEVPGTEIEGPQYPRNEPDDSESWQDRIFDWWRDRWRSWRGNRSLTWGNERS
jgi:hypothetical protein